MQYAEEEGLRRSVEGDVLEHLEAVLYVVDLEPDVVEPRMQFVRVLVFPLEEDLKVPLDIRVRFALEDFCGTRIDKKIREFGEDITSLTEFVEETASDDFIP